MLVDGVVRSGALMNLSPSGIQIEARHHLIEQLGQFKSDSGQYPEFEVQFPLPDGSRIQCRCNISHCRRLSQDVYHLGLGFAVIDEEDDARLDAAIHHLAAA